MGEELDVGGGWIYSNRIDCGCGCGGEDGQYLEEEDIVEHGVCV